MALLVNASLTTAAMRAARSEIRLAQQEVEMLFFTTSVSISFQRAPRADLSTVG